MVTDPVRQFPPTMQFFSTCVELLGKVHLIYLSIPYRTVPYHTMPCHTMPCHAMPCHAMPYHTIPYHTIPYHTMPCHAMPYYNQIMPYYFFLLRRLSWRIVFRQRFYYVQYWLVLKSLVCFYQYFNPAHVRIVLLKCTRTSFRPLWMSK